MTKRQMWNRYQALKKKDYNWSCRCAVCGEIIHEGEEDIEYILAKRKTDVFVHAKCVRKWNK